MHQQRLALYRQANRDKDFKKVMERTGNAAASELWSNLAVPLQFAKGAGWRQLIRGAVLNMNPL